MNEIHKIIPFRKLTIMESNFYPNNNGFNKNQW